MIDWVGLELELELGSHTISTWLWAAFIQTAAAWRLHSVPSLHFDYRRQHVVK